METEQVRHQRYSASFSNSHKVLENYQYLSKKIRTNVCENFHSVVSDKNDLSRIFNALLHNTASKQGNCVRQLFKYTTVGLRSTCMGLVDFTRHLLEEKKLQYVCRLSRTDMDILC